MASPQRSCADVKEFLQGIEAVEFDPLWAIEAEGVNGWITEKWMQNPGKSHGIFFSFTLWL
jgi:hypothetical protein